MQLIDLDTMDRAALIAAWSDLFSYPAPKGISQSFLRRFLAVELQTRRHGGLSRALTNKLARGKVDKASRPSSPSLKPGGRLLREWNGVTHVVDVIEAGLVWRDQSWRSLSAIAREITGAHWSGPRFFGLTGAKGK
ncbi:DUF2924 domain-containing protein [Shimia sp. R9_3]|uniref:DUF2924 domain-containing protein n=1 Tax=Shimia sp. R9_3 TaxID=2821113 RepID=UPI001ADC08BB|nr:DUF2924 domain-containing protein [Shimia sp. R9_3]MBO9400927.1 DUF2924 domain-containing protein [Shimia sp. R9_3]